MKADHKNIIVTGGGDGVGRQLVLELLTRGAAVKTWMNWIWQRLTG
nr:hypothetical protein [uncultured Clostridium sp.]